MSRFTRLIVSLLLACSLENFDLPQIYCGPFGESMACSIYNDSMKLHYELLWENHSKLAGFVIKCEFGDSESNAWTRISGSGTILVVVVEPFECFN